MGQSGYESIGSTQKILSRFAMSNDSCVDIVWVLGVWVLSVYVSLSLSLSQFDILIFFWNNG